MQLKNAALACVLSLGVALTGWSAQAAPKMEIQIATGDPGVNYFDNTKKATLLVFADYLERVSGGELKCKLAVGTLGGEADVFQQTMLGTNNIAITTEGSRSAVVWNAGEAAARNMEDIGAGWRNYVCIEAANVSDDAIELAPGGRHRLKQVFEVKPL